MEWNIDDTYESFSQMQYEIGMDALEMLNPKPGELILDIGCGTGNLTVKIAEKVTSSHKRGDQNDRECGKVIGIDKDKTMIEGAQKRKEIRGLDNLHFMQIDAIQIDYHNEFDAVFSNIVIHWVKDLNKLFEKLYISLKKKGRITIA